MSNIFNIILDRDKQPYDEDTGFLKNGAYGSVQRVVWNSRECAVKYFHKREQFNKNNAEVENLSVCNHTNIVKFFGAGPDMEKRKLHYFVMEFAPNGSLEDLLHDQCQVEYSLELGLLWVQQCCLAVDYLHTSFDPPYLHRDIKPSNLLLFQEGRHVKLCDFGTVKMVQNTENTVESGTFLYMAPEVMISVKDRTAHYNQKCDIYSIAVVLWEILTRQRPFSDIVNTFGIIMKVALRKESLPDIPDCPPRLQQLMKCCWQHSYKDRPDVADVVFILKSFLDKMDLNSLPPLGLRSYSVLQGQTDSGAVGSFSPSTDYEDSNSPNVEYKKEQFDLQMSLIEDEYKPKDPLTGNCESEIIFQQHQLLLRRYVHLNLDCQRIQMQNNQMLNSLAGGDSNLLDRIKRYCALKAKEENLCA